MSIITDPLFYAVAIPAIVALGLSKGGFAGIGVLATPLTALYLPPLEAAALILPVLIVQDAISVWWYRKDYDAWNLKVLLPGALAGMGLAWIFAAYVSDAALRISVGVIGISFVIYSMFAHIPAEGRRASAASGVFWGGVSGFTSFLSQAGGPPFQVHTLPQRLPKLTLVGTTTIFFAIVNALKIGPYFALGQFSAVNFATSLLLLPLAVAANALGIWLVRVTPMELFYRIAYTLVFCVSAMLLWQGVTGLMNG
ncbi:sulfite exporter TauE/SafE family protein [Pseudorhodoplanes sp.]|uniref:sulfite exporter TauE/SafE family protein n=1 Tax=Pseudorhodoplanes sp. TaxID=1934341 RepID=UPI003919B36A